VSHVVAGSSGTSSLSAIGVGVSGSGGVGGRAGTSTLGTVGVGVSGSGGVGGRAGTSTLGAVGVGVSGSGDVGGRGGDRAGSAGRGDTCVGSMTGRAHRTFTGWYTGSCRALVGERDGPGSIFTALL